VERTPFSSAMPSENSLYRRKKFTVIINGGSEDILRLFSCVTLMGYIIYLPLNLII